MKIIEILRPSDSDVSPISDFSAPAPAEKIPPQPVIFPDTATDPYLMGLLSGQGMTEHKAASILPMVKSEGARLFQFLENRGVDLYYPISLIAESSGKIALSSLINSGSGNMTYPEILASLAVLGDNIKKEMIFISSLPAFSNISPFSDSGISLTPRSSMAEGVPVLGSGNQILNISRDVFANLGEGELSISQPSDVLGSRGPEILKMLSGRFEINLPGSAANAIVFDEPVRTMPGTGGGLDPALAGSKSSNSFSTREAGGWGKGQLASIKSVLSTLEGSSLKNTLSNALTEPISKYANNLVSSLAGAASSAASTIPSLAGSLISDVYSGLGSALKGGALAMAGLSSGRDAFGRSTLLADSPETPPKTGSASSFLSKLGLTSTSRIVDNAVANLKNRVNSALGVPLESNRMLDSLTIQNRFSYWRLYSSDVILGGGVDIGPQFKKNLKYDLGKDGAPRFQGYPHVSQIEARVDNYYDFYIGAPADLREQGLPPFLSRKLSNYSPAIYNYTEGYGSGVTLKDYDEKKSLDYNNMSWQANLDNLTGVTLDSEERYSLGAFGEVCLTSRLSQVAQISLDLIEDEALSVRSWMEAYLEYMYKGAGYKDPDTKFRLTASDKDPDYNMNLNPNLSRPIYQGYYYIVFMMLDCFRKNVLRQKTYYAVPRFDLSMRPTRDIKHFQVSWEVIGEEGLYGAADLSIETQASSTEPTYGLLGDLYEQASSVMGKAITKTKSAITKAVSAIKKT